MCFVIGVACFLSFLVAFVFDTLPSTIAYTTVGLVAAAVVLCLAATVCGLLITKSDYTTMRDPAPLIVVTGSSNAGVVPTPAASNTRTQYEFAETLLSYQSPPSPAAAHSTVSASLPILPLATATGSSSLPTLTAVLDSPRSHRRHQLSRLHQLAREEHVELGSPTSPPIADESTSLLSAYQQSQLLPPANKTPGLMAGTRYQAL